MEIEIKRLDDQFEMIEEKLSNISKLTVSEKKRELDVIQAVLAEVEVAFDRFELIGMMKHRNIVERFEARLEKLKNDYKRLQEGSMMNNNKSPVKTEKKGEVLTDSLVLENNDQLVVETNEKLKDGRDRALNMLKMANSIRDELNMIDDEVLLQREKLLEINRKMKETQGTVNQTKKLVFYFSNAVSEDKILKTLIVSVLVIIVLVIFMAFNVNKKQKQIEVILEKKKVESIQKADYDRIDEGMFNEIKAQIEHISQTKIENQLKKKKKMKNKMDAKNKGLMKKRNIEVENGLKNGNKGENDSIGRRLIGDVDLYMDGLEKKQGFIDFGVHNNGIDMNDNKSYEEKSPFLVKL